MAGRISLTRIGNARFTTEGKNAPGSLEYLVRQALFQNLDRRDAKTFDVLHEVLQNDPQTKRVTGESLQKVLRPANEFLAASLATVGKTLANRESFPLSDNRGGENAVRNHSVRLAVDREYNAPLPPTSGSAPWKNLSYSYLRKIGFQVKRGKVSGRGSNYRYSGRSRSRASQEPKRFWSERGRRGSRVPGARGMGKAAEAAFEAAASVAVDIGTFEPTTRNGNTGAFSVSDDVTRRRARTYTRVSTKGRHYVVYSVTGDLLFPRKLALAQTLNTGFTRVLLKSMETGTPQPPGASVTALLRGKTSDPAANWHALVLANETYRPWMGPLFSRLAPLLIRHLHDSLRREIGLRP